MFSFSTFNFNTCITFLHFYIFLLLHSSMHKKSFKTIMHSTSILCHLWSFFYGYYDDLHFPWGLDFLIFWFENLRIEILEGLDFLCMWNIFYKYTSSIYMKWESQVGLNAIVFYIYFILNYIMLRVIDIEEGCGCFFIFSIPNRNKKMNLREGVALFFI
jgi:hypothetical protein